MKETSTSVCLKQNVLGLDEINNKARELFDTVVECRDFGCQFDYKKDNIIICTCKRIKRRETGFFSTRQVFRSQRYYTTRDFTDIGVGSVKTLCKKKVRKIYLPQTEDRGVGSSDWSDFHRKSRKNWSGSYYEQKKTSSKCVGGIMEQMNVSVISKKLSPIIQKKSGSTSPTIKDNNKNDVSSSYDNVQEEKRDKDSKKNVILEPPLPIKEKYKKKQMVTPINKTKTTPVTTLNEIKNYSSDSFEQHVYNLENPSYDKSKTSFDLIENKLEREYRKIFSTNSNEPIPAERPLADLKSSMLRRRFAALRKLGKKEEKTDSLVVKVMSISTANKKDVSIVSDPPSLEARSYSNTKIYSPSQSITNACKKDRAKKAIAPDWSADVVDNEYDDVKGMFKLWGKKFNLEENNHIKTSPNDSVVSKKQKKRVEIVIPKDSNLGNKKKEGKRFSFFRKKNKEEEKNKDKTKIFKSKKGVTAGRCEVGDGLMIKIGAANDYKAEESRNKVENLNEYDILRKAWFRRFLYKEIDSQNSVRIRWNNKMYGASSSTVFELMDCLYKNREHVGRSKSQVTTDESSYYSYMTPTVNFMHQDIQAWMIPTITDDEMIQKNKIKITYSNQKWFIDKSKAFSRNIELVLRSNVKKRPISSEYIIIDIPKGYFSKSTSTNSEDEIDQMSDEQVYNIVEYEATNSKAGIQNIDRQHKIESGDSKNIHLTISVEDTYQNKTSNFNKVIKNPPIHRDVVIQGSTVYFPTYCDIIEVGIITQRDMRDKIQPLLKTKDDRTDDESKTILPLPKTCELAENFLQDYYKNVSLGFDILTWCISDSKLKGSSENDSLKSTNNINQCDGSKSCPNMVEEYRATTIVSSCETSSCSRCGQGEEKQDNIKEINFLKKIAKKSSNNTVQGSNGKRVLTKDSVEVYKKRKLYAISKAKWIDNYEKCVPDTVRSVDNKGAQKSSVKSPKSGEPCGDAAKKKHVSLQDCDVLDKLLKEQLSDKVVEGILSFKGSSSCDLRKKSKNSLTTRKIRINSESVSEIPQPPCKDDCLETKNPVCSKKNSVCNVPGPPSCPTGPPNPCQKRSCPPSPPACRLEPSCFKPSNTNVCPYSPKSSSMSLKTQSPHPNPIPPPRINSPQLYSPKSCRSCFGPKTQSLTRISNSKGTKNISSSSPPSKAEKDPCQEFIKSKNTPTGESKIISRSPQPNLFQKISSKGMCGIKNLVKKLSDTISKDKECDPICKNKSQKPPKHAPTSPSTGISTSPPCRNITKMTGLQLKKMPRIVAKKPSKEEEVIRLNSKETITVKLKCSTPSTEEIREGCNIRVEDEDGQTLYERKDYTTSTNNSMHYVRNMYHESQVQRISTPDLEFQNTSLINKDIKSSTSFSNIIEINFNLKLKQRDKTIEVCTENCGETTKNENETGESTERRLSKESYELKEQTNHSEDKDIVKKDINIKIMINNGQTPNVINKEKNETAANFMTGNYPKTIKEKFITVCTGCSDVIDNPTLSIHQATIHTPNSPISIPPSKSSMELLAEELKDPESVKLTDSDETVNETGIKENNSNTDNTNIDDADQMMLITESESQTNVIKYDKETSNDEKYATSFSASDNDFHSEKETDIPKIHNKEEKKQMLKEIFETSSKERNKSEIRQMLRATLTSDSSGFNVEVQKWNDQPYDSLKPAHNKNSHDINIFSKKESSIKSIRNEFEQLIYPTEENNSECSDSEEHEDLGCICNQLADKLKINMNNGKTCCCRRIDKTDEEITCNLKNVIEKSGKTEVADVETQNSNVKNGSDINEVHEEKCEETNDSYKFPSNFKVKACQIKKLNRRTVLGISDDDEIVLLSSEECSKSKKVKPIDILELYEMKKAVLEIYAQKMISDGGEKIVARLPKFVYQRESEIRHYQEILAGIKLV